MGRRSLLQLDLKSPSLTHSLCLSIPCYFASLSLSLSPSLSALSSCKFVLWHFLSCCPVAHFKQPKSKRIPRQSKVLAILATVGCTCNNKQAPQMISLYQAELCRTWHPVGLEEELSWGSTTWCAAQSVSDAFTWNWARKSWNPATPKMQAQMPQVRTHLRLSLSLGPAQCEIGSRTEDPEAP